MNCNDIYEMMMNDVTIIDKEHGRSVGLRFEPYHDVIIYEDGFEEWIAIGD